MLFLTFFLNLFHSSDIFPRASLIPLTIEPQLTGFPVAKSLTPSAMRARPRGIPTPVRHSMRPIASLPREPAIDLILVKTPLIFSLMVSQLIATAVPRAAAPDNINPTPRGIPTPVKHRIIPITRAAAPAIASILVVTPFSLFVKVSQLRATAVPIAAAPARIRPTPRGVATPVKARIIPMAMEAAPAMRRIFVVTFLILSGILFQFKPTVAARPTAPAAIIAIPSPVATPVRARIAPTPIKAPLTIATMLSTDS